MRRTLLLTGILTATQLPAHADFTSQLAQFSSPKNVAPVDAVVQLMDAVSVLRAVQVCRTSMRHLWQNHYDHYMLPFADVISDFAGLANIRCT